MDYTGEHLLPGQIGQVLITVSFVASVVATFAYFKASRGGLDDTVASWRKLARLAFLTEVISVVSIFATVLYIIQNHLFEYHYAWRHSSLSLEPKYMLACFWEGQEGSFLLWSLWHCLLGLVVMRTGKSWEAPVMTVVSFAQVCLATMVAGIYVFNWKMGSTPFILLRDSGVLDNAPALHENFDVTQPLKADYLASIQDGNDLNVLLQNYWMVIHPPVLFLGFASTTIPFAYAIAGLWKKDLAGWTRHALPWSLFSAAALGVGIMMGAAWAYESLSFGGYWAWDPVENASLVPWMVLVAGIHTLLIFKHTGHSLRASYVFIILAFLLVLYSTFLTRSGILGDNSVHAFTESGMNLHLIAFMSVFFFPAAVLFVNRYRQIPTVRTEENMASREFWIFIGSLVLFLSALVIIGKTSVPVINKLFRSNIANPEDPEFAYNQIQVFVAVIIGILSGFAQYLKYKDTPTRFFWKKMLVPTILSAVAAVALLALGNVNYQKQGPGFLGAIWLATASSVYAIITNASYIWLGLKGRIRVSGGSIAHVGFGMVLLGILLSSAKKEVLSYNNNGIPVPIEENKIVGKAGENITLVKGMRNEMGGYYVTFEKATKHPAKEKWFYTLHFKSKDGQEEFTLTPSAFINARADAGLQAEPDARHYLDHDVFTYITAVPDPQKNRDTSSFRPHSLKLGDTLFYGNGFLVYDSIRRITDYNDTISNILGSEGSIQEATLRIHSKTGSLSTVHSRIVLARGAVLPLPDTLIAENLVLQLQGVNPDRSVELGVKESSSVLEYITLKAYKFPYIIVLWAGVIITAIGILISMLYRTRQNRRGNIEI